MKLEAFFEKFELFADAPGAVEKMREMVLELAVTGKLVPQNGEDSPASMLMEKVREERARLEANGKIKVRSSQIVEEDERPFVAPTGWEWVRLSDIGYQLGQKVPDRRFTYIDVGSIDADCGRISERAEELEPGEAPSRARKLVDRGTVIYSTVRPYLRNIAIIDQDFDPEPIASTAFGILHPFSGINNRYLFYWLRSATFTAYVLEGMKGMAYPAINDEKFYNGFIALPPTTEQKRIVAKVDELMALCDRIEVQQRERVTKHTALARASLSRFADAPTPANLDFLFHNAYAIEPSDIRKAILTLAVRGKLVPQDPGDESVDHLLGFIENHREKMADSGSLRRTKSCRKFSIDEAPHDIPVTWVWTMLGEITDIGTGSTPSRTEPSYWTNGSIPWVTSGSTSMTLIIEPDEYVTPEAIKAHRLRMYPSGTLLVALYGQGKTRGQVALLGIPSTINQACAAVCPLDGLDRMQGYLKVILEKQYDEMRSLSAGGAQPNLNIQKIKEVFVPLPPLAEQRRIVARVNQLMAQVDQLESQLATSRAAAEKLLDALVVDLTKAGVVPFSQSSWSHQ